MNVSDLIVRHEGTGPIKNGRSFAYRDSAVPPRLTIGNGRNLDDRGLSKVEVDFLRENDISDARRNCEAYPWFSRLSEVRQAACISLMFAGAGVFAQFVKFHSAMATSNWPAAAAELLDSDYARQTKTRAKELARMIEQDQWPI